MAISTTTLRFNENPTPPSPSPPPPPPPLWTAPDFVITPPSFEYNNEGARDFPSMFTLRNEAGSRCVRPKGLEAYQVSTTSTEMQVPLVLYNDACSTANEAHLFRAIDAGNGLFLLQNVKYGLCVHPKDGIQKGSVIVWSYRENRGALEPSPFRLLITPLLALGCLI